MSTGVYRDFINVIGEGWMPYGIKMAQTIHLSGYDLRNVEIRIQLHETVRDAIDDYLGCNTGDFSHIDDWEAFIPSLGIQESWRDEESFFTMCDLTGGYDE